MLEKFSDKWNLMESTVKRMVAGYRRIVNAGYQGDLAEAVTEVEDLCLDLFITDYGTPNYSNIHEIRNRGFKVYPTESDSFGWLMAACENISTHSIIYFG